MYSAYFVSYVFALQKDCNLKTQKRFIRITSHAAYILFDDLDNTILTSSSGPLLKYAFE